MTYKQGAIKAIWRLIEKFEKNNRGVSAYDMPLCDIYITPKQAKKKRVCYGCPNHCLGEFDGCSRFETLCHDPFCKKHNSLRAKFWHEAMPTLEKILAKYYTPSGWCFKVFVFLDDIDRKIIKEYRNE